MARSCDCDVEAAHDIVAQQRPEFGAHDAGRPLDLSPPRRVLRLHVKDLAFQLDRGHPSNSRANSRTPRKRDLVSGQRCLAQDYGERLRHDLMDRDHASEDSIDAWHWNRNAGPDREGVGVTGAPRLVLASASPRRAELLHAAGFEFDVMPADVDEATAPGEQPEEYVCRVAQRKVDATALEAPGRPILGADTIVVVDVRVFGKPVDEADARRMLGVLSGRTHTVMTGVCLVNPAAEDGRTQVCVGRTRVEFAQLSQAEIDWYVASGEPADKAGGYAIQGLGSRFVTRIDGSYSNVVGLPVALVYNLCRNTGLLVS